MKNLKSILNGTAIIAVMAFAVANAAQAAVILSEDFENERTSGNPSTAGANYTTATSNMFYGTSAAVTAGTGNTLRYLDDATAGISFNGSRYLRVNDVGSGAPSMRTKFTAATPGLAALTGLFTLSLDFYETSTLLSPTAGTTAHFKIGLGEGDMTANLSYGPQVFLAGSNEGTTPATTGPVSAYGTASVGTYTLDAPHHLDIVGNAATATNPAATYMGGTLPGQTFDLYLDGVLVMDNAQFRGPNDGGTEKIAISDFLIGNTNQASRFNQIYIDNLVLQDIAAIPEPATLAMASIALVGLGIVGTRRNRAQR